jgi:fructuronate reductase
LGAFHRAHQVWATEAANRAALAAGSDPAALTGYASFTGRRAAAAERLAGQDGLYHLLVRAADGDRTELVQALVDPHDGADVARLEALAGDQALQAITLTVTEAGYRRGADGGINVDDSDVAHDLQVLRTGGNDLRTAPGRLLAAVRARDAAGLPPLAMVSCDNLLNNGATLHDVVADLAARASDQLAEMVAATSFVHTMVDRITPHTTDDERAVVAELTGLYDADPVICEPFTEWVLAGEFPSGRPDWEPGGARFVDDVEPFEQRKLWLLNGAHSLLAYVGALRGHALVDQAMGDPHCVELMNGLWDDAAVQLRLPADDIADYRKALTERFVNPRIAHRLAQIAGDGSQKLPIRIVPVLLATRAAGGDCAGGVQTLGAYVQHLRGRGVPVNDVAADRLTGLAAGPLPDAVPQVLAALDPRLADDAALVTDVRAAAQAFEQAG